MELNILQKKDLLIKRIRFKPGYQNTWRKARENLKELLNLKFTYQKKLTKFLIRFYRISHLKTHTNSLVSLEEVLLSSKLLPDPITANFFSRKNFIYLNGKSIKDLKLYVFVGDFTQLVVSN